MKALTIADAQSLEDKEIIPSISGLITEVYSRLQTDEYSVQAGMLTKNGAKIKFIAWNTDELSGLRGKAVTFSCHQGKNGLTGVYAHDNVYQGKTTRELKITATGQITISEKGGDANAIPSTGVTIDAAPTVQPAGVADNGVLEARKHIMQSCLHCYRVEIETTNSVENTFYVEKDDAYFDCVNGICYIATKNPASIYLRFGKEIVKSITEIGIAYTL